MCNHHNIVSNEDGTSTCIDCSVFFEKSLYTEPTIINYNGPIINLKLKSTIRNILETDFGISDYILTDITEKIFLMASKNKKVKGINKKSLLCASLYYAYHYLEKPKDFRDVLVKFNIKLKIARKGLKICQVAIQESSNLNEIKEILKSVDTIKNDIDIRDKIHSYVATHRENLESLIKSYNISLKNYDEIEKIVILSHVKKRKDLNDNITSLWISCIYFWLLKIDHYIEPEEFVSINNDNISIGKLMTDLNFLNKNLNIQ